jgi:hypothetical protein
MKPNQETPVPGRELRPEDLKGNLRVYYNTLMQKFTGYGMSHEDRSTAAMVKVRARMDKLARQAAAEKKQFRLF